MCMVNSEVLKSRARLRKFINLFSDWQWYLAASYYNHFHFIQTAATTTAATTTTPTSIVLTQNYSSNTKKQTRDIVWYKKNRYTFYSHIHIHYNQYGLLYNFSKLLCISCSWERAFPFIFCCLTLLVDLFNVFNLQAVLKEMKIKARSP